MDSKIFIIPLNTRGYSISNLEDILPTVIHFAVTGDNSLFTEFVNELTDQLTHSSSDLVIYEDAAIRKECYGMLKTFTPLIKQAIGDKITILDDLLSNSWYVSDVNIIDQLEITVELTYNG